MTPSNFTFMQEQVFLTWVFENAPVIGCFILLVWLAWSVRGTVSRYDHRLNLVETRLDKVEARLDKVETKLDRIENRLTVMETKFDFLIAYITSEGFTKPGSTIQKEKGPSA